MEYSMFFFKWFIFSSLVLAPVLTFSDVTFIGLDKNGKEIHQKRDTNKMVDRLHYLINSLNEKIDDVYVSNRHKSEKELNKIRVGLGISAALGFGSVIEASSSVGGFLIYERNKR